MVRTVSDPEPLSQLTAKNKPVYPTTDTRPTRLQHPHPSLPLDGAIRLKQFSGDFGFLAQGKPSCFEEAGRLLGLFGPEVVQFFEMKGSSLTFFCTRSKKPGAEVKVRVMLVDYKVNRVDIPLKVVNTQPCGRGQLCEGRVEMSEEHLRQLEDLLYSYAVRANLAEEARRSPRLALGLKAMSRDIPGYNCVTIDFSRNGVLLNCHGPLEQGQLIQFNVDTEMHSLPSLSLQGRVIFCRENGRNRGYQVAIDLAGLSDEQQEALDFFLEAQTERMSGNLMQRQIGDGGGLVTTQEEEES